VGTVGDERPAILLDCRAFLFAKDAMPDTRNPGTTRKIAILPAFSFSDLVFAFGLLMLFSGLWLMVSLALALTVCGALLIILGVFSAWVVAREVKPDA